VVVVFPAGPSRLHRKDHLAGAGLQARADYEKTGYVLAPAQTGLQLWAQANHGARCVIDPWGTVLADALEFGWDWPCTVDTSHGRSGPRMPT